MEANFSGYATKNGLRCSDGRTIMPDAFKHNDEMRVPLVWQHRHDNVENVLGHAILENREDGVYAYGFFNETPAGQAAKKMVEHGDVNAMSIYANGLKQQGDNVTHGNIKEVSLVLSGANPGALIDNVNIQHSDGDYSTLDDEVEIFTGLTLEHANNDEGATVATTTAAPAASTETVKDVIDSMSDKQKEAMYFVVGEALSAVDDDDDDNDNDSAQHSQSAPAGDVLQHQEGTNVARNVFDQTNAAPTNSKSVLSHSDIQTIVKAGIKGGSFKEAVLAHADEYGITNIELMFPDSRALTERPDLLARQAEWVQKVLSATKHAPFAKIKSLVADLTAAEARAKGYIKGNMKKEEVIKLLRRTTGPTTVYKKQKLDRDDIIDITDLDIIAWLKWEIRFMLDEELARAILIGDGRSSLSEDKIKDPEGDNDGTGIRSIVHDHDLYSIKVDLPANVSAEALIDEVTRSRSQYRGQGTPTMYTTDRTITDLLLLKDKMGRRLYETEAALATALRVKEIVPVEVLDETPSILAIIVNLADYTVGTNRGGEVTFFEDFDIDFNQNKYLMEARLSGALTKPKSAIVVRREVGTAVTPVAPSFNGETNTITIPTTTGVIYEINDEAVTGQQVIDEDTEVSASAAADHFIPANTTRHWTFTYTEV